MSAIGLDQTAIFGEIVQGALIDLHVHQAAATEGKRGGAACAQCHGAQLGNDGALVADVIAQQCHIAAVSGIDAALIDDAARAGARKTDTAAA